MFNVAFGAVSAKLYWTDYVKYEVLGPNSIKMQYDHGYSFNFENVTILRLLMKK